MAQEYYMSPCTMADVHAMGEVYGAAFHDNPLIAFWYLQEGVTEEARKQWLYQRTSRQMGFKEYYFLKMTEGSPEGRLVGWLRYQVPHQRTPEEQAERKRLDDEVEAEYKAGTKSPYPVGANPEACAYFFGGHQGARVKYLDSSNQYAVDVLAIHPDAQGKGLGKRLLKTCLDLADADGKVAYIEATIAGRPLYSKMGFEIVETMTFDLSKFNFTCPAELCIEHIMMRQPRAVTA